MRVRGANIAGVVALALGMATQAAGFPCTFSRLCSEANDCTQSALEIDVDIEAKVIDTHSGLVTIVAVKQTDALITMFATGLGAEYLLSLTPETARFTSHANAGPEASTYLGRCKGAF
ncbi:hypothetical protein N4R57_09335 [Rhodobacteraceae bacterium D3-12]|nr:hypothetical protein N4R57_09335 [Rhodobacteraceae bacterium D3-12]